MKTFPPGCTIRPCDWPSLTGEYRNALAIRPQVKQRNEAIGAESWKQLAQP